MARSAAAPMAMAAAYVSADQSASRTPVTRSDADAVAEETGDQRVAGRQQDQVRLGQCPTGLGETAGHHRGHAGERQEGHEQQRDQQGRPVVGREPSPAAVDPGLEGERSVDDEVGHAEGRDEPQPERDEPDGTEAGDRRDGRQDDRLDRHAEPGLDRGRLVVEDLERAEEHRAEQGAGRDPDERRFEEPRQPDDGDRDQRKVAAGEALVHR